MVNKPLCFLIVIILFFPFFSKAVVEEIAYDRPVSSLLAITYSGHEVLEYDISWTGGIKIGELRLEVEPIAGSVDAFRIKAHVNSHGFFRFIYPVDDTFETQVRGPDRLPYEYRVHQLEGHSGSETRRLTLYDQNRHTVHYQRDNDPEKDFLLTGSVHNEFSSFFSLRNMKMEPGQSLVIPTFADEKRHEVQVSVMENEQVNSLLGKVRTMKLLPKMKFKGLYDKTGDTIIWVTTDECRVPVRINSKILIGSLTAKLTSFTNSSCSRYPATGELN